MPRLSLPHADWPRSRGALAACVLAAMAVSGAKAETTPFQPAATQPLLPASDEAKPTSPVVESLMGKREPVLHVRKAARPHEARARHLPIARLHTNVPPIIERPALAGVELPRALPRPGEPPHIIVPLPAYGLDSVVTAATMPAPPIVCHPARRDPDMPDPRLYRERTVVCEADNP